MNNRAFSKKRKLKAPMAKEGKALLSGISKPALIGVITAFSLIIFSALYLIAKTYTNLSAPLVLFGIFLIMSFSAMSTLTRHGISVTFFLLFGIAFVFGPIIALLLILLTTILYLALIKYSTPFDSSIIKNNETAIMRSLYFLIPVLLVSICKYFFGYSTIMQSLTTTYLTIFLAYVIGGYATYLFTKAYAASGTPREIILRIAVSFILNWWIVSVVGAEYVLFLETLF